MGFFSSVFAPSDELLRAFYAILFQCAADKDKYRKEEYFKKFHGVGWESADESAIKKAIDDSELFKEDSQETKKNELTSVLDKIKDTEISHYDFQLENLRIVKKYGDIAIKELISIIKNIFPYQDGDEYLALRNTLWVVYDKLIREVPSDDELKEIFS